MNLYVVNRTKTYDYQKKIQYGSPTLNTAHLVCPQDWNCPLRLEDVCFSSHLWVEFFKTIHETICHVSYTKSFKSYQSATSFIENIFKDNNRDKRSKKLLTWILTLTYNVNYNKV